MQSMERMMIQAAYLHDLGSTRHRNLKVRLDELEKNVPATFESKLGENLAHFMSGLAASGAAIVHEEKPDRTIVQPPSVQQAEEAFDFIVQSIRSYLDANLLTQDPIKKRYSTLSTFHQCGLFALMAHNKTATIEVANSQLFAALSIRRR